MLRSLSLLVINQHSFAKRRIRKSHSLDCVVIRFFLKKWVFSYLFSGLAIFLLLSGCSTVNVKSEKPGQGVGLPSEEKEIKFGNYVDACIQSDFMILLPDESPKVYTEVQKIGKLLVKVCDRPHLKYTFRILNTDMVNAFAGPGGYVYVTTGLLEFVKSRDEIAGVMTHEIGHVCARHVVKQFRNVNYVQTVLFPIKVASYAYKIPLGGDLSQITAVFFLMGYSRDYERQADYLGVKYMLKAGYDPNAMVNLLKRLWEEKEKGRKEGIGVFFRSHPPTPERIKYIKDYIKELKGGGKSGKSKS